MISAGRALRVGAAKLRPGLRCFSVMRAITVDPELKNAKPEALQINENVPLP